MEHGRFSLEDWRSTIRESSASETTLRYRNWDIARVLEFYQNYLPRYGRLFKQDFVGAIEKVADRKEQVAVLDVGCGTGMALAQLKERFGQRVVTWGVSLSDLRTEFTASKIDRYLVDDIHKVNLPSGHFDVIVAYQSFRYFADPMLVLKRCWRWLKKGGFCFVDSLGPAGVGIYWQDKKIPTSALIALLKQEGYRFQWDLDNQGRNNDLVFKKNRPRLVLPIKYDRVSSPGNGALQLKYCWIGRVPRKIAKQIASEDSPTSDPF